MQYNSIDKLEFNYNYLNNVLGLSKGYKYFNAGVVLYNLKMMRSLCFTNSIFQRLAEIKRPYYQDQDVLNSWTSILYEQLKISYKSIDQRYNQHWFPDTQKALFRDKFCRFISQQIFIPTFIKSFFMKRQCAFIVHYIGGDKPWKDRMRRGTLIYKEYVRSKYTPNKFKEEILINM